MWKVYYLILGQLFTFKSFFFPFSSVYRFFLCFLADIKFSTILIMFYLFFHSFTIYKLVFVHQTLLSNSILFLKASVYLAGDSFKIRGFLFAWD